MLPDNTFVIIGPESTGKTTLCQELAKTTGGDWIPEYARTYIENLKRKYTYDDVIHIAKKQIELEETYNKDVDSLFIDTDLIITKVWLLHVFKDCPAWMDEYLKKSYRKSYLVTYPDLPWEFDPVRENPTLREFFLNWYIEEIKKLGFPFFIIKGNGEQRVKNAISYLESSIKSIKSIK